MGFSDLIIGLLTDIGKEKFTEFFRAKKLKKEIEEYLERDQEQNESRSLEEEIDFEGLANYIRSSMKQEVTLRLFGNSKERKEARESIRSKAQYYAVSNGKQAAEAHVIKIVTDVIDIIKKHCKKGASAASLLVAAEAVEEINSHTTKEIETAVCNIRAELQKDLQKSCFGIASPENTEDALNKIRLIHESIRYQHRVVGYKNSYDAGLQRYISEPIDDKAAQQYPKSIQGACNVTLGENFLSEIDSASMDYAYRHQLPLTMNITEAKAYLGELEDPNQAEAEALLGQQWVVPPKPFPPAFPCSILANGNATEFEYLLFRTREILDDGTFIIDNVEQEKFPLLVTLRLNIGNKTLEIEVGCTSDKLADQVLKLRLWKLFYENKEISIKSLTHQQNLATTSYNNSDSQSKVQEIETLMELLKHLLVIESYIKQPILMPKEIRIEDFEKSIYISKLIKHESVVTHWKEVALDLTIADGTKDQILGCCDGCIRLIQVGDYETELFGRKYIFPVERTYNRLLVKDSDKVKRKLEVLEIGEALKVIFVFPDEDETGTYTDVLAIPENQDRDKETCNE